MGLSIGPVLKLGQMIYPNQTWPEFKYTHTILLNYNKKIKDYLYTNTPLE